MSQNHSATIGRLTALLPLSLFLGICTQVYSDGAVLLFAWQWVPGLGANAEFVVDGLSTLFGLIISGIGVFVVLFSAEYMKGHRDYIRFFLFLHLFLLSMLGLVFADNLLTLFIFWELTTVLSYLLIGFENNEASARDNARQALLVTGAGGLALLIGFLIIGSITQTYRISAIAVDAQAIRDHMLYGIILGAIFTGAFTKSAQFPFHFWLPNAMSAPTPISAYLHSATMVKAGIYLLARFHPILGGTDAWMGILVVTGGITAIIGAVLAVGQSDLKRLLAYTTIMALGILTMFLGGKTTPALTAAITFLLVHSLYKSSLFLVVGVIDHETGTRDVAHLGGLIRSMPATGYGALMAALSMAGFPLFLGFIGKEILYKGALTEEVFPVFATSAAVLSNSLMVAAAGIILIRPFFGHPRPTPRPPHEAPVSMWLGPVLIGTLGIVFGIFPDWVGNRLVQPAVAAFHPTVENIQLKLFYGFNEPLLLSILTILLGTLFYLFRRPDRRLVKALAAAMPVNGERGYGWVLAAFSRFAAALTQLIQNGSLYRYLLTIVCTFGLTVGGVWLMNAQATPALPTLSALSHALWLLAALILVAVVAVARARSRLLAVCALGMVGSGAALIFLVNGAPDVALTQLLVETLTLIIVSIVLLRLPRIEVKPSLPARARWLNLLVATGCGMLVAALTMAATTGALDRQITTFFEQHSYVAAHGRNIVNVILVDFRSLDTLGEIVVVATAGLAGFSLLARRKRQ
jgi:multicomponent Na+:H+ antiporter subunit A